MDRTAVIAKLAKCKHNPIHDVEALEKFSDAGLTALQAHCDEQSTQFAALEERAETAEEALTALQEKVPTMDTQIKSLEGQLRTAKKPLSEEDWMKQAPESIRGLVERQKKLDDEKKEDLVETLKAAQEEYSEAELKAMSVVELERTARILKLNQPQQADYTGARPVPRQRDLAGKDDVHLNPPDPWEAGIKGLQARQGKSVN